MNRHRARRSSAAPPVQAILALAIVILAGCGGHQDWLEFRGVQGRGFTPNAISPPLAVKWKLQLQFDGRLVEAFNQPVVVDSTIFFGSHDGNFYALDVESGYMRWIFKSRAPINSVPFADDESVYFGSNDGHVYAVGRDRGEELWRFDTRHTVQSLVMRYGDQVMFTSDRGDTYFLDLDGQPDHRIPNPVWSYHTFQVYDGVMYWAPGPIERGVSFGAYDIEARSYLWIVDSTSPNTVWYSFPALDGDDLYYSTGGDYGQTLRYTYYALDRHNGTVRWRYQDSSFMGAQSTYDPNDLFYRNLKLLDYMAPAIWRNLVIYTSGDAVVRGFDRSSGRLAWQHTFAFPTSSAPTIARDRIYFGVRGGNGGGAAPRLVCLSARTGKLLWEMETEGAVLNAPVISGDYLIFGTDENFFYVLEEVF